MSAILESLLDDQRRAECLANDGAIAMGRPIIAYQPTVHHVQRTNGLYPSGSERSNTAQVTNSELG